MALLTKLKNLIFEAFFPPICLNCKKIIGKEMSGLCAQCFASIEINKTFFCGVCRARLPNNNGSAWLTTRKICHKNAPYILAAATGYQNEIVRKLIWRLKYRGKKQVVLPMTQLLVAYIDLISPIRPISLVCPIPLHSKRLRERGFNQAELLAETLAKKLNLQIDTSLIRVKNAPPQVEVKDNEKRKENIECAFSIRLPPPSISPIGPIKLIGPICPIIPVSVTGKNILLVDDVCTTGSTLKEAALALKAAGAKKIIALVIAKT